jgi:enediyne biosynthesis protein E4
MRFTKVLLAIVVLFSTAVLEAEVVSRDEATRVGQSFLEHRLQLEGAWNGRTQATLGETTELERGGRVLGYWIPIEPQGHIIVSSLRELPAIKAFSDTNDFDPDALGYPELILDVFESTLDFLEETYGSLEGLPPNAAPVSNRESWTRLLDGASAPRERTTVGPLLQSSWHQGGPYNNDCPPGDGGTCVVGCVATAAAQILNYWEYPEMGDGSHGYTWDGDESCGGNVGGGWLDAQFWDSFDWDNILDNYNGGYDAAQAAAAAELNHEMGIAFDMDYGVCGSGAYLQIGTQIYPDYFRYSPVTIQYIRRSLFTAEEWWEIIKVELDAVPARPISYGIHSHAIVCDGYMDDGGLFYHMNYGWGGGNNSWYALDNVYCPWSGCDFLVENMTIGIEPLGHFTVHQPADEMVWTHGESMSEVAWFGSEGSSVSIDLYRGDERLTRLIEGSPNDGSETPGGAVPVEWGTGADYRVKVVDEEDKFGWSAYFSIYAPAEWSDGGAPPVDDEGRGQSVAWGDFDSDGLADIYLANRTEGNCLFRNGGEGLFEDAVENPLDVVGDCRAVAWADIDNDGDLDLFLTRTSGESNFLFRNDGDGFTDLTTGLLAGSSYSMGAAWGDYDADGLVDLYVVNVYAPDRLFHNEGGGVFTEATASPLGDAGYGRSSTWTDYDSDGDLDLYLVRYSTNKLYRNDGESGFTQVSAGPLADSDDGYGGAWGDYDNDGDLDLYLVNHGANKLIRNDGAGVFTDVSTSPMDDVGVGKTASWADTDNDGYLDLFLANDGSNRLLHNNGDGSFSETTDAILGDPSDTQGAAWADYDGDGRLDLYIVNDDASNRLIHNESNSGHHWLHLDLVGTVSNRSALGARLRLVTAGSVQIRELGSETAYLSQGSLRVEFGLAGATMVDSLEIFWPSGASNLLLDIGADQLIEILEDADPTDVEEYAESSIIVMNNFPNPFNPKTEILFELPASGMIRLDVFDVQGRVVLTLAEGYWAEGRHSVSWTGVNKDGDAMGSGLYFARLTASDRWTETKLLLLK